MSQNGNTAIERRSPQQDMKNLLSQDRVRTSLAEVATKHLTPERLTKVALLAASRNPQLYDCTPPSLLSCLMTAASLGLDPSGGSLGEAYLIPFRNNKAGVTECQIIVGYRGLIALARRSGEIQSIEARVVYEDDSFELEYGLTPRLRHVPKFDGDKSDEKIRYVYAIARLKDSDEPQVEVMTREQVEAIRGRSRAGRSGPWVTDYAEMSRKTVVRRLVKYLPLSAESVQAIETVDRAEFGDVIDVEADAPEAARGKAGVKARLAATKREDPQPDPSEAVAEGATTADEPQDATAEPVDEVDAGILQAIDESEQRSPSDDDGFVDSLGDFDAPASLRKHAD